MSEINIIMLNRFLDLKNLYVAKNIMCLAQILKKILRILSFGGHLGRHLEYFNFPNDAKVASFSFNVRTYWRTHLCKNILCGLFFWVASKIFIWQPDYYHGCIRTRRKAKDNHRYTYDSIMNEVDSVTPALRIRPPCQKEPPRSSRKF